MSSTCRNSRRGLPRPAAAPDLHHLVAPQLRFVRFAQQAPAALAKMIVATPARMIVADH